MYHLLFKNKQKNYIYVILNYKRKQAYGSEKKKQDKKQQQQQKKIIIKKKQVSG